MAISLPRPSYVMFNGNALSDHNRSPVAHSVQRIENRVRTARGKMRKSFVADKSTFGLSWQTLPANDVDTVDGRWGANSIINFYNATPGPFTMSLVQEDGSVTNYTVVFNDLSRTLVYRYGTYYYDVELSVEEV